MTGKQGDGNQLPPQDTQAQEKKRANPYEFNKLEEKTYNGDLDTPFARAWSRAYRAGRRFGPCTSDITNISENAQELHYQYAVACLVTNKDENPNQMVEFRDGHGLVYRDSGL